jgi:hypothetical protein
MHRRHFLACGALAAAPLQAPPLSATVKPHLNKPTLFVNDKPVMASFYALTDATGGRFSYDELPQQSLRHFAALGFKLYQVDLFLADCLPAPGKFDITPARRQLAGVLAACSDAAIVLRWHLNAPDWWKSQHPAELTQYANGTFEDPDRKLPTRYMQDDLRRTPRASIASTLWLDFATTHTRALLTELAKTPEGNSLIGIHIANGVYGEWHYWGFMRNEPDTSAPMQRHFATWRKSAGRPAVPVPSLEDRKQLTHGIFRSPSTHQHVVDYYRCQQQLVVDRILHFAALVKRHWPRPILTGTFYGYFFSMFDRHVTGGHIELHRLLSSPHIDYLSAPQAYGELFRNPGGCGITRALIESIRHNGKLFLDEMDQTPSWKWRNDVDEPFVLSNPDLDYSLIRRNILEGFTRGAGHWYYDFGPANNSGWWADKRLRAEIDRLHTILRRYHDRPYQPAGDVLVVFDTEVFYYTGSIQGADKLTDPLAVNRTIATLYQSAAAIETVHLKDLPTLDLTRFKVVIFANTWLMTAAQRRFIRTQVIHPSRHVIFQGLPGYADGLSFSTEFTRELTGLDFTTTTHPLFAPALSATTQRTGVQFFTAPPAEWRSILASTRAHLYSPEPNVIHAGAGLVLVHRAAPGATTVFLRNGKQVPITPNHNASVLIDAETGEILLA